MLVGEGEERMLRDGRERVERRGATGEQEGESGIRGGGRFRKRGCERGVAGGQGIDNWLDNGGDEL